MLSDGILCDAQRTPSADVRVCVLRLAPVATVREQHQFAARPTTARAIFYDIYIPDIFTNEIMT